MKINRLFLFNENDDTENVIRMRGAIALGDGLKENATLTGLFLGCKNTSNRVFFESAFNFSF